MRIAYVVSGMSTGGAQTMLLELAKNLNQNGFVVKVFIKRKRENNFLEKQFDNSNIECEYLNLANDTSILKKIKNFIFFSKKIKKFNPDIIHVHLESPFTYMYSLINRKKIIVTIHSWPDRILTKSTISLLNKLISHNLIQIVCCANCVANRFVEMIPKSQNFVHSIYNPIDLKKYNLGKHKNNNFTFIHVSRMHSIKNQKLLIKAFSKVHQENSKVKLVFVGDGELMTELKNEAISLNVIEYIDFLGNREDIPQLLSTANAFVLSSYSECCPMVVLEAMASGLPIVSTDVGGIKEIVCNAGLFSKSDDANDLANNMLKISSSESLEHKLSKNALENVKKFDSPQITKQYEQLYKNIL